MLLKLIDDKDKLVVKDILDIDFDMYVEELPGQDTKRYCVKVNKWLRLSDTFAQQMDAEAEMLSIADIRNRIEREINYYYTD